MEATTQKILELYRTEAALFNDLLECVNMERENLINLNIDNLWALMEEKRRILDSIEDMRGEIKDLVKSGYSDDNVPLKSRPAIMELSQKITNLKEREVEKSIEWKERVKNDWW